MLVLFIVAVLGFAGVLSLLALVVMGIEIAGDPGKQAGLEGLHPNQAQRRPYQSTKKGRLNMTTITTIRSPGAIALGLVCAVGTAVVLFWHIGETGITTNHVMVAMALIVALGSGHLLWSSAEFSVPGIVRFCAFLALFVASSSVCVTLSAGRGHEHLHVKVDAASQENGKRTALVAKLAEADTDRKRARTAHERAVSEANRSRGVMASECASGEGPKCKGKMANVGVDALEVQRLQKQAEQTESHYWVLAAQLADLKPEQVANIDLKQAAKLIAFVFQTDEAKTFEGVELLWPYALALITEFGTIAFLNYGFGHKRVEVQTRHVREEKADPIPLEVVQTTEAEPALEPLPAPAAKPEPAPAPELAPELAVIVRALETGRKFSNRALARRLKISPSECSKRVSELDGIVERKRNEKDGRKVMIALASEMPIATTSGTIVRYH